MGTWGEETYTPFWPLDLQFILTKRLGSCEAHSCDIVFFGDTATFQLSCWFYVGILITKPTFSLESRVRTWRHMVAISVNPKKDSGRSGPLVGSFPQRNRSCWMDKPYIYEGPPIFFHGERKEPEDHTF